MEIEDIILSNKDITMCHKIESVHGQSLICVTRNVLRMIKAHFLAVSVLLLALATPIYTRFFKAPTNSIC